MANRGFRIGFPIGYQLLAAFGQYNLTGQVVVLTHTGAGALLSWNDAGGSTTGYKVYWATTSWGYLDAAAVAAGIIAGVVDVGNVLNVANSTTFPGIGTGTRYFNIRPYDISGLEGPWISDTDLQKIVS